MRPSFISSAGLLTLAGPLAAAPPEFPKFRAVDVDTRVGIGYGVAVADVNGDKRPDILLVDKDLIAWYENPGWSKHVIVEKLTPHDHVCLAAADIDGDGRAEIAAGAGWNPNDTINSGAVFYLIPPADRTQKWEPVALPHEPTVHRMRWVRNRAGQFDLVMVPLHGRGNKPATGDGEGVRIVSYRRPTDPRTPWTTRVLDDSMHKTHNFDPMPAKPGEGQTMLVAGREGVFHLEASAGPARMTQLSGTASGGAGEVRLGRLANGPRFFATVEPMHGTNLVVYLEPPAGSAPKLWSRHVLDSSLADGHAVGCGDFIGTGGDQVVVGWRAMGKPGVKVGVKLFAPTDGTGTKWVSTLIDDNKMACEDLCLADLNADGRLDVVAAGRATKNLKVYFNEGRAP